MKENWYCMVTTQIDESVIVKKTTPLDASTDILSLGMYDDNSVNV